MLKKRTLKYLVIFILVYFLLLLPGLFWDRYLDTPVGILLAIPYLSIYLFHNIGIPFLLQNNGLCGWGWCAPTIFGWMFLLVFWLLVFWVLALIIASLTQPDQKAY
jgi:hypothetical protein